MNILILSPFFYPEPISTGKYNTVLSEAVRDRLNNASIDVVCSHPIYPSWKVSVTDLQLPKINVIRGGRGLKFPARAVFRRAVLEMWYVFHVTKSLFFKSNYTHVVAIFPPSLFALVLPALLSRAKIIGIVHDLQGVYASRNNGVGKGLLSGAIRFVEARAFKSCDKLIFLSQSMLDVADKAYSLDRSRCSVHYPFVTIEGAGKSDNLSSIIPDNQLSIVYSGALGEKQAPKSLAELMLSVKRRIPDVELYIFSQGPEFESLKNTVGDINYLPLVDEKDLPELLERSSVQILPQASGSSDGSLPSKLPNLMASGCKIACITDPGSELVDILSSYSKAFVSETWDIEVLVDGVVQLIEKESLPEVDEELLDKFRIEPLVERIVGD